MKSGNQLQGAERLIGLAGIKEDLNVVNDTCLAALELLGGDPESVQALDERGRVWLQSYYTTAVITYARCFAGGVRTRLSDEHVRRSAGEQADAAVEVHKLMLLIRDKHLAHPVSAYEDGNVGIIVRPDGTVWGLDIALYRQAVAPQAFGQLQLLASKLLTVVNELIVEAYDHARAKAAELSVDDLAALGDAEWIPPQLPDLEKRRKDGRAIPVSGAWGYLRAVTVADDAVAAGQTFKVGPDGPRRSRQSVLVDKPDEEAVFTDLGEPLT
ncbi:hypothetical protein GCM10027601_20740 [Nocardioides ungokensis]|uniref:hypothetical protein n=1 Tax=Nocardioides ungokensis TaxID=1643322 RepID=UPI0015DFB94D|nr:hypothetical protein [Nocardioides ungokensis]